MKKEDNNIYVTEKKSKYDKEVNHISNQKNNKTKKYEYKSMNQYATKLV